MRQGNDIQLTHIAQEFGYFDQSHFIREFKAFSGVTPKTFLSDNNISFVEIWEKMSFFYNFFQVDLV